MGNPPPRALGERSVEHECGGFLRIGGREQHAHIAAFGGAHQNGPARTCSIQDSLHVPHSFFQRRKPDIAVGQTRAALVEQDQPRKRAQPLEHMCERREYPSIVQIGYPARHIDDIERAIADRLIGDAQSVTSCVACARSHDTRITRRISACICQCRGRSAASAKSGIPFPFHGDRIGSIFAVLVCRVGMGSRSPAGLQSLRDPQQQMSESESSLHRELRQSRCSGASVQVLSLLPPQLSRTA